MMHYGEIQKIALAARMAENGWPGDYPPEWMPIFQESGEAYYRFLYYLASIWKPKLTVELGTWKGTSALCMAKGNPEGRVVSIDMNLGCKDFRCMAPNLEFRLADSIIPHADLSGIDVLFIDTIHDGKRPKAELERWIPLVNDGGIILFDDVALNAEMRQFWAELEGPKIELPVHGEAGFGVLIKGSFSNSECQDTGSNALIAAGGSNAASIKSRA